MKEFDYYIFVDYSENYLGYLIIDNNNLKSLFAKSNKFSHYKELRYKSAYIHSIKSVIEKCNILDFFIKHKIKEIRQNIDIYLEIIKFLKEHENCIIFISVDNHEYSNFEKFVKIIDGNKTIVKKESQLIKGTPEYKASLVLDTLLNIERLSKKK
jgi:hypothetical protein